jgi:dolichol-phosphate mannosyltransferase
MRVSVVIPVRDEADNLPLLLSSVPASLQANPLVEAWELVLVDDGSSDGSREILARATTPGLRVILLDGRQGKEAALAAGIDHSLHDVVAFLDGDHQAHPDDLGPLLAKVGEGFDAAVGVRVRRNDPWLKRASSKVANRVRAWALLDDFPDINCPVRAVRRSALLTLPRFRTWHRYVPVLLRARGFEVAQVPIRHFPRQSGRSKYGVHNRLWIGLRSLVVVRWLIRHQTRYRIESDHAKR